MRPHAALEIDLDKVRAAALQEIMERKIEPVHASGLG